MPQNSIRGIKRRIKSVKSIEHITNAMKLVSSAKLRKAKNAYEKTNKYLTVITQEIEEILKNADLENKKSNNTTKARTCYIAITSNGGLCGSFSSNIIKKVLSEMNEEKNKETPAVVAIGNKGREYFIKRGYEIIQDYLYPPESVSFEEVQMLCKPFLKMYDEGEIDKIVLVYNAFIDSLMQKVMVKTLLPYECKSKEDKKTNKFIEYEPSDDAVFNYIIPKYSEVAVYKAIIESATCEHAARRIAMENATDNALEMIDELSLEFNTIRQAAITNEISEIVRGAEALK
ncbi:MAG: ATP synthase F1 subunit gamma [Eubacteriaceae bacterium]|nr:ATP synthase F1 subunit gamma [Eubacteriaceae bacterium]